MFFRVLLLGKKKIVKLCLEIFSKDKSRFWPKKICTSDSRISVYFPRGLTHGFGQKIQNFLEFVF